MSFGTSAQTRLNAYIDLTQAPYSGYLSSPLTAALDFGAHDALNVANVSAAAVITNTVSLPAGSSAPGVSFGDPVDGDMLRCGIAQVTPGSSQVQVTYAGVSNASVILATYHLDSGAALDATATAVEAVETDAGSFYIKMNAAATAATKVAWFIAKL